MVKPRFSFIQEFLISPAAGNVAGRWPLLVSSLCGLPYLKRAALPKVCLLKVGQHRIIKVWPPAPTWNYCKGSPSFELLMGWAEAFTVTTSQLDFFLCLICFFCRFWSQGHSLKKLLHGHLLISVYFLGEPNLQPLLLGYVLGVLYWLFLLSFHTNILFVRAMSASLLLWDFSSKLLMPIYSARFETGTFDLHR